MNNKPSTPDRSAPHRDYHGGQVMRGGGEFVRNLDTDFWAAVQSLNPDFAPSVSNAEPPAADGVQDILTRALMPLGGNAGPLAADSAQDDLARAFGPLRQVATQRIAVLAVLDNLRWTIQANDPANDGICADYIRMIACVLPKATEALQLWAQDELIAQRLGPQTKEAVAALPSAPAPTPPAT
jgi:hypothetical protein